MYEYEYIIIAVLLLLISVIVIRINKKDFTIKINKLIQFLGGKENIIDVTKNMSRLNVKVKDTSKVDKNAIEKLGAKGIVEVDNELKIREDKENELVSELSKIKDALENKEIVFKVKTGASDKVFGNISKSQIADEIKKMGFNIDKKCIKTDGNIDTLGVHKVLISLHKKVEFFINVVLNK